MVNHIINIAVNKGNNGQWVAVCDNYEAEPDDKNRFYLRISSPGWSFDHEAPAPTGPGYPPLVSPKDHPSYVRPNGTHSGVWVHDPSSSIQVIISGNAAVTLSHGAGHGIDRHQYAICLMDNSKPINRCVLDPYLKDKPGN